MKKILFITNVPSPYRIDFFNELGKSVELTALFEAKTTSAAQFTDATETIGSFRARFLSDGAMDDRTLNPAILRELRRGQYDHIVATNYGFPTELAAILSMRLRRIPYWLELDGGVLHPGENPVKRALKRTVIRGAEGIFSTGSATDRVLLHYGAMPERLHRYPFSSFRADFIVKEALPDEEKAALRRRLGITAKHMTLSVGQFIPRKGFDVLLDAAAHFPEDTAVCIVGGKPTAEYTGRIRSLGLKNVLFRDFMPMEELRPYYLAADVFVLPTREDIWGLVINEAMASALPVVTTHQCVAGTELVQNGVNGWLVAADNAAETSERVRSILLDDALRRKMAAASLSTIAGYTIEQMAEAHVRILGEAAP